MQFSILKTAFIAVFLFLSLNSVSLAQGGEVQLSENKKVIVDLFDMPTNLAKSEQNRWIEKIVSSAHTAIEPLPPLKGSVHGRVIEKLQSFHSRVSIESKKRIPRFWNGVMGVPASVAENVNLFDVGRNAKRWFNMFQPLAPRELEKHVQNMTLMFPVSHTTEMIAGPMLGVYADKIVQAGAEVLPFASGGELFQNAPVLKGITHSVGSAVGFLIMIPGFDPLCLLLQHLYVRHKSSRQVLNAVLTIPRIIVFKGAKRTLSLLHLDSFLKNVFRRSHYVEQLADHILRPDGHTHLKLVASMQEMKTIELRLPGKREKLASIDLRKGYRDRFYLSKVTLEKLPADLDLKLLKQSLKPFKGSVGAEILSLIKRMQKDDSQVLIEDAFWIKSLDRVDQNVVVKYYPNAISLKHYSSKSLPKRVSKINCFLDVTKYR